jgi:uncharacterized protein (TIGR02996 family)
MTADLDALYEAVLKDPDSDVPRLTYADACEVYGDSDRAEFIRLQIAETAARRARQDEAVSRSFQRRVALQERFGQRWAGPIRDRAKHIQFFRGFVEKLAMDAQQFLEHAEELYAMAPIRRLTLTGVPPVIEPLSNSQHLARIVWLNLEDQKIGNRGVESIAMSPYMNKLGYLGLDGTDITAVAVEALAASSKLSALRFVSGLPKAFQEDNWWDQGQTINVLPPPEAARIEQRYGRKLWLHPLDESSWRGIDEDEF